MRNSKKLIAVIMTVALLASMMIPALAASYQTEATALTNAGLMNGTPGTGLDTLLTRDQGIAFTVRAMGAEKAAIAMTAGAIALQMAKVVDFAAVPGWATNYAAYAIANKITNGNRINADGRITFSAKDPLSGRQFITMMLRSLGYTGVTLDNCLDKAVASGMLTASKAILFGMKAQLLRDDAAYIIYSTVNMGNVALAGGITVGAVKLVNYLVAIGSLTTTAAMNFSNYVAPTPVAPALLTVTSVTATNLKEIVVKFSAAPDKASAETATNYTLSTGTVSKAVLIGDTVTLTLMGNAAQQAALDVTVKNVKSAAGVAIVEVTKTVTMFDVTLPMFVSYVFTGPQTIELTYSEPIMAAGTATIDNGIYGASTAVSTTKNNVIVVSLGTSIPVGVHTLKMVGVKDYAYTAIDATISITYVADTTAPTVVLSKATQTSVTLTFSKDVKGLTKANFYHTYTSYGPKTVKDTVGNEIAAGNYYNEVVLDFSTNPLPAGLATVVVLKAVGDVKVMDRWGNVMAADAMLSASTTADLIAPTVAKVEATSETTVVVTYSEDVTGATTKANYVFKKTSDGTVVTPAAAAIVYNATDFTATITFAAMTGGSYTAAISGIKDASLNTNTIATVTLPFLVSDKTPILSANALSVESTTPGAVDYIYVTYPELMMTSGTTSILNLDNYKIGTAVPGTAVALPTGSTIAIFGTNDRVKISITGVGAADVEGKTLYVRNLADAAGNVMTSLYIPIALAVDTAPKISAVKTTALNKLDLTVDKNLSGVMASDILVNGTAVAFATYVNNTDGTATISVILNASTVLAHEGALPTTIQIIGTNIKSLTGMAMAADTDLFAPPNPNITPTDGIAPVLKYVTYMSPTQIIVRVSEILDGGTLALSGKNGFSVSGGTLTSALKDPMSTTDIILTGTGFTVDTDVTYTAGNIADVAGNTLATVTVSDALSAGFVHVTTAAQLIDNVAIRNNVIVLDNDITLTSSLIISGANVLINGYNHSITNIIDAADVAGAAPAGAFTVRAYANGISIQNVSIVATGVATSSIYGVYAESVNNFTMDSCTVSTNVAVPTPQDGAIYAGTIAGATGLTLTNNTFKATVILTTGVKIGAATGNSFNYSARTGVTDSCGFVVSNIGTYTGTGITNATTLVDYLKAAAQGNTITGNGGATPATLFVAKGF